jgi:dihydrofolate reductase
VRPLALIVAMTPRGIIGKDGTIPWRYPEDLKRFKRLTTGHAIIMGRKTFDSIGKALPGRANIVVSRSATLESLKLDPAGGHGVFRDFGGALEYAYSVEDQSRAREEDQGIFRDEPACPYVIGGAEIYRLALPLATRADVTVVHGFDCGETAPGLTRFPGFRDGSWHGAPLSEMWGPWRVEKAEAGEAWEIEYLTFVRRERS